MTIKTVNHWGKWISSDVPITGVLSTNDIAWEFVNDEICLTCEEIINEIDNDDSIDDKDREYEFVECDGSHTRLLGDWIKGDDGLYGIDNKGEFAAIERETTVQVVYSKFITHGKLCSPCYPGQLDVDIEDPTGDFVGYTLPDYLLRKDI